MSGCLTLPLKKPLKIADYPSKTPQNCLLCVWPAYKKCAKNMGKNPRKYQCEAFFKQAFSPPCSLSLDSSVVEHPPLNQRWFKGVCSILFNGSIPGKFIPLTLWSEEHLKLAGHLEK